MNILIVAAHPDDEVLGCGGTMARYAEEHEVHVLILGEGLTSRLDDREWAEAEPFEQLRADATKASKLLGVSSVEFGGLPDNQFDQVPLLQIIKMIEGKIRTVRPEAIYTHHSGDLNVDHGLTCRAVLTATRPGIGHRVQDVFSFEIRSSTEWAFQQVMPIFDPMYLWIFLPISKQRLMRWNVTQLSHGLHRIHGRRSLYAQPLSIGGRSLVANTLRHLN